MIKNEPQIVPKSTQIYENSVSEGAGGYFGCHSGPRGRLDLENLNPRTPPAPQVGSQNRPKIAQRSIPNAPFPSIRLWIDFGTPSEPILVGFRMPKRSQKRSKSDSKRDHGTKTRILNVTHKNQWFLMILGSTGNRKSIKNHLQNELN